MMKEFELFEHTADIGVIAYGNSLQAVFANAAKGMFSIITDLDNIKEIACRSIALTDSDLESLFVSWLNELIYIFDVDHILFKRFDILELSETRLKANGYGEKVNKARHEIKAGIKAATYHMLKLEKVASNQYQAKVLFDI